MKQNRYQPIKKTRREYFGGILFCERPAFISYVNKAYADAYQIPETKGAILRDGVFSAPLDAHFAVTTKCNMFCTGCYNTRKEDTPKDISLDKAKAVIDKLAQLGVFSLSFGGGEPTLHPEIFKIAAYAREKQVLPNMTTNGLTMTKPFAEKCVVFGNVHFSIHHLQDLNHVFSAAQIYARATGNKPGLNLLLTTETLPCLDEIIHRARTSGIKKILFLRYKTTAKNADVPSLCADRDLRELPARLKTLNRADKRLMFLFDCSLFEILAENAFSDRNTFWRYDSNGCMGGNAFIAIDIHGMYRPCSFSQEYFGNILDLDFNRWMNDSRLNQFRNRRRDEACTLCAFEVLCGGGCRLLY